MRFLLLVLNQNKKSGDKYFLYISLISNQHDLIIWPIMYYICIVDFMELAGNPIKIIQSQTSLSSVQPLVVSYNFLH